MLAYPGISKEIQESDVDYKELSNYKIFLTEGYLWDHPGNDEIIRNINSIAKSLGVHTAFTFGDEYIVKKHRNKFLKLVSEVDIIISNEGQILSLFDTNDIDYAVKEVQRLTNLTIITQGPKGAMIVTPEQIVYVPAEDVGYIIDSTGAGDQFAAGFLYAYSQGKDFKYAADLGTKAAAQILQQIGAKPKKRLAELLVRN
jgi:sugar/nucleoside kinase (ribokinase family)